MADKKESKPHGEEETKIPVFTVLKNGAILKNIFIVNNHRSPSPPPSPSPPSAAQNPDQDHEEILTVGRHPDCSITLTHPSISRFHLQIHSNPSKQHLSVVDLSSVHGTWVSGKKAEPGMRVELKEEDTVRVGGSSREYRLHWVPLSRAYDLENPFVPPKLDVCMTEEKEEENAVETYQDEKPVSIGNENIEESDSLVVEGEEEKSWDENSFSVENREIQSQDLILEGLLSLFSVENLELIVKKEIPSAPLLPENTIHDEKEEDDSPSRIAHEPGEISSLRSGPVGPVTELVDLSLPVGGVILETENQQLKKVNWSPKPHSVMEVLSETDDTENSLRISEQEFKLLVNMDSSFSVQEEEATHRVAEMPAETENSILLEKDNRQRDVSRPWSGPLIMKNSLPVEEVPTETNNQQVDEGSHTPQTLLALQSLSDRGKEDYCTPEQEINLLVSLDSACSDETSHSGAEFLEEAELSRPWSGPLIMENSLLPVEEVLTETNNQQVDEGSHTPQTLLALQSLSDRGKEDYCTPEQEINLLVSLDSACSDEKSHSGAELLEEAELSRPWSGPLIMENSLLPVEEVPTETNNQQVDEGSHTPQTLLALQSLSDRGKEDYCTPEQEINLLVSLDSACSDEKSHSGAELLEEAELSRPWSGPLIMENSLLPVEEVPTETNNQQVDEGSHTPQTLLALQSLSDRGKEDYCTLEQEINLLVSLDSACSDEKSHSGAELLEEAELSRPWSGPLIMENSLLPVEEVPTETNNQQVDEGSHTPQTLLALQSLSDRGKEDYCTPEQEINLLVSLDSACSDEKSHSGAELLEEAEHLSESSNDLEKREISSLYSVPITTESMDPSLLAGEVLVTVLPEVAEKKESLTQQFAFAAAGLSEIELSERSSPGSEEKLESCSIWSRRGKPASVPQIQTGASRGKTIRAGVDAEVGSHNREDTENKMIAKALFTDLQEEEESFTPNKENFTPNTLLVKSLKMKGRTGEIKHSKSWISSSSKITFSPGIHPEEDMTASSDKENHTPKIVHEQESARPTYGNRVRLEQEIMPIKIISERVPFQSLLVNSTGKSRAYASVPDAAMRSCNSVTCTQTKEKFTNICSNNSTGEAKRSWNMVVDTTTLLNKESRKSLLLLQGLKGTHLIIPRMVLRELDTLKRRGSLYRRTTEASLVLEWIEECMMKTKGWIHVQSSFEEDRALAPTPPAFPQSPYGEGRMGSSCGTASSMPFSSYGSLIDSPTAEDHILDYALLYRKRNNDGRLVILSDDVTLKIKAMAEGLICETAQEFRESLVNPFSERFLWADSSPRGLTWSYLDDVVLREQYSRRPLKKSAKGESAKGLKLILLHNSHYGQISSVS